ncbi:hypothetical protein LCGC14_0980780 [marine sediment metagenome]|uniref:PQ loop repeat protein n=1 Tax=marine sediment metagenome TaxID=412755 RepID=A0A0F9N8R6_9ZZZZ
MNLTQVIGWVGVVAGASISLPQVIKSYRSKSTAGVSRRTYQLLLLTIICYLIRAVEIGAPVFIVGNSLSLVMCIVMLTFFGRYGNEDKD